jgi:hypothetical protein
MTADSFPQTIVAWLLVGKAAPSFQLRGMMEAALSLTDHMTISSSGTAGVASGHRRPDDRPQ